MLSLLPKGFKTAEQRYEDRLERERQALLTQAELDRANVLANHQKRRALLDECRDLAHKYTRNDGDLAFRAFLEGERAYADIRGHLSAEYLAKLNAPRTLYVCADGARYPTLVSWFLNDLDRLEKEWGLV